MLLSLTIHISQTPDGITILNMFASNYPTERGHRVACFAREKGLTTFVHQLPSLSPPL